jgi:hypothetical protein
MEYINPRDGLGIADNASYRILAAVLRPRAAPRGTQAKANSRQWPPASLGVMFLTVEQAPRRANVDAFAIFWQAFDCDREACTGPEA